MERVRGRRPHDVEDYSELIKCLEADIYCDEDMTCPPLKKMRIDQPENSFSVPTGKSQPQLQSDFATKEPMIEDEMDDSLTGFPCTQDFVQGMSNGEERKPLGRENLLRDYGKNPEEIVRLYQRRPEMESEKGLNNTIREILFPKRTIQKHENMAQFELRVIEKMAAAVELSAKQRAPFSKSLIQDILSVSDDTFEMLMSRHAAAMNCGNLSALVACASEKYAEGELVTQDNRKFVAIIRHGLFPRIHACEPGRTLYELCEKLSSIDEDMVIDHLLIPLIVSKGTLMRALQFKLQTHKLLLKLLEHMVMHSVPMSSQITTTLGALLDKEFEYLLPPASDHLFTLLKASAGYSMNEKLAGFYYSIMKKFIDSMTERELSQLHSLNVYNETIFKSAIEELVANRIRRNGHDGFLNTPNTPGFQTPQWQRVVPNVSSAGNALQDEEDEMEVI